MQRALGQEVAGREAVGHVRLARAHPLARPAFALPGPELGPAQRLGRDRARQHQLHRALLAPAREPPAEALVGEPRVVREPLRHRLDQRVHPRRAGSQGHARARQRAPVGAHPVHGAKRARLRLLPQQHVEPRLVMGFEHLAGAGQDRLLRGRAHGQGAPRADQHGLGRLGLAHRGQRVRQPQDAAPRGRPAPGEERQDPLGRKPRGHQPLHPVAQLGQSGPARPAVQKRLGLGPGAAPRAQLVPKHDVLRDLASPPRRGPGLFPTARSHQPDRAPQRERVRLERGRRLAVCRRRHGPQGGQRGPRSRRGDPRVRARNGGRPVLPRGLGGRFRARLGAQGGLRGELGARGGRQEHGQQRRQEAAAKREAPPGGGDGSSDEAWRSPSVPSAHGSAARAPYRGRTAIAAGASTDTRSDPHRTEKTRHAHRVRHPSAPHPDRACRPAWQAVRARLGSAPRSP